MRRILRRVGIGAAVLCGLLAVGTVGLRMYLSSGSAKRLASDQLTQLLGGQVKVTQLDSGLGSTAVHIEVGDEANGATPLLKGVVQVDVSPVGLAAGQTPGEVVVENATVTLRFDKDGNLITKLPQPPGGDGGGAKVPDVRVRGAAIDLVQADRPPFKLTGIDLSVTDNGSKLVLGGAASDPVWKDWKLTGEWARDGSAGTATLTTAGNLHVTPAHLKSLPLVPAEAWQWVDLEGDTPVAVTVSRAANGPVHYSVECHPTGTRLTLPPADLTLTDTAGNVVVEGAKVTISDCTGKTADGTVRVAKTVLDFGPAVPRLTFDVAAQDLNAKKLPASWKLPTGLIDDPKLNAVGKVTLTLPDGKAVLDDAQSNLRAKITGGFTGGGKAFVGVRLVSQGGRLRFVDDPAATSRGPVEVTDPAVAAMLLAVLLQVPPAAEPAVTPENATYVRANLKLTDVDLAELLKRLQVEVPVKLAGKVNVTVAADIPVIEAKTVRLYRAKGSVTLPSLAVEGLTLENVTADIELRDGVLTLSKLAAEVPNPGGKAGAFAGTAKFGLDPRTDLTANLTLNELPLGKVVAAVPGYADAVRGPLSGSFTLTIPGEKLRDPASYVASGKLTSPGLVVYGRTVDNLAVDLALKDGIASLTKATADVYDGTVTGSAQYPLADDKAASVNLAFKGVDTAALTRDVPDSPVKLTGKVSGTLDGTLPPAKGDQTLAAIKFNLAAPKLTVQGIPVEQLEAKLAYKTGELKYDLTGKGGGGLGGSIEFNGTYPLTFGAKKEPAPKNPPRGEGKLRIDGVQLARLGTALRTDALNPLRGRLDFALDYTHDDAGVRGTGKLRIDRLGWGDDTGSDLVADVRLTPEGIDIPDISGRVAGGSLRGRVTYDLAGNRRNFTALRLENADAALLLKPLGVTDVEGRMGLAVRGVLGREPRGSGTITATRTTVSGIEIADFRVPFDWTFSPRGSGSVVVREASGTVANGRVVARAEVSWGSSTRVSGRADFTDVNVGQLATDLGGSGYGIGKTSGRFDLTGTNVKSVNDLTGNLTASFGDTSVRELPVLGSVSPFLSPVQSLTWFRSGDLVARLGNGRLNVERLALSSESAKLFADGSVGLNGSLDLDVVASTGQIGAPAPVLRAVARNVPAVGPIPVGLIVRASEALSNRVLRLHLTGTVDRPVVRANAAAILGENAVRFFVGQYSPVPLPVPTGR